MKKPTKTKNKPKNQENRGDKMKIKKNMTVTLDPDIIDYIENNKMKKRSQFVQHLIKLGIQEENKQKLEKQEEIQNQEQENQKKEEKAEQEYKEVEQVEKRGDEEIFDR